MPLIGALLCRFTGHKLGVARGPMRPDEVTSDQTQDPPPPAPPNYKVKSGWLIVSALSYIERLLTSRKTGAGRVRGKTSSGVVGWGGGTGVGTAGRKK